jgi:hypothetical protein
MSAKLTLPNNAFGRSLCDFEGLTSVELKLIECCRTGPVCEIAHFRPEASTLENAIRPSLIRFLALGGDNETPIAEKGVILEGAWIEGNLDFQGCKCPSHLALRNCKINGRVILVHGNFAGLSFSGSEIQDLHGNGAEIQGSLQLKTSHGQPFKSNGALILTGASIGRSLECNGANFFPFGGVALQADGINVKGEVDFVENFSATGTLRLVGAKIGGGLNCSSAKLEPDAVNYYQPQFRDAIDASGASIGRDVHLINGFRATGAVKFNGTIIGGSFFARFAATFQPKSFPSGDTYTKWLESTALSLDGAKIGDVLFLGPDLSVSGPIRLVGTQTHGLIDNPKTDAEFVLDGFTYDSIDGGAATDAKTRIAWLNKQPQLHLYEDFKPQPWEQLVKVLRSMGHLQEAADVAIAKQKQLYCAGKIEGFDKIWHKIYGWLIEYGYRPNKTIAALALVFIFCAEWFDFAKQSGWMAPSSPIIHTNQKIIADCLVDYATRKIEKSHTPNFDDAELSALANCRVLPNEYTTFNPIIYSLDLILPLVNLQQDSDWSPMVLASDSWFSGRSITRLLMWFEILFGWMASLLLVTVLGNLVKKD